MNQGTFNNQIMFNALTKRIYKLSSINNIDYRFIPFGAVAIYILTLLFAEFYLGSYTRVGNLLGISPIPYFVDLKVLLCGIDAIRAGTNPYVSECGVFTGFFNYPEAWGAFALLPFMTGPNIFFIGFSMAVILFILLYFHIGRCNLFNALAYTALLISPSIMLGFERGNCDLIIFMLLLSALFFKNTKFLSAIFILFAGILKLYPIGAIISLLNNLKNKTKYTFFLIVGITTSFILYLFIQRDNIVTVSNNTPRRYGGSTYGLGEIPSMLRDIINTSTTGITLAFFSLVLIISLLLFCYYILKKAKFPEIESDKKGTSYLIGVGVFITTCLIGYNWEYRLIFLLFTIPQILKWIDNKNQFSTLILISTIIITWQSFISKVFLFLDLSILRYHYFSQLLVIFIFISHGAILFSFLKSFYRHLTTKSIKATTA